MNDETLVEPVTAEQEPLRITQRGVYRLEHQEFRDESTPEKTRRIRSYWFREQGENPDTIRLTQIFCSYQLEDKRRYNLVTEYFFPNQRYITWKRETKATSAT